MGPSRSVLGSSSQAPHSDSDRDADVEMATLSLFYTTDGAGNDGDSNEMQLLTTSTANGSTQQPAAGLFHAPTHTNGGNPKKKPLPQQLDSPCEAVRRIKTIPTDAEGEIVKSMEDLHKGLLVCGEIKDNVTGYVDIPICRTGLFLQNVTFIIQKIQRISIDKEFIPDSCIFGATPNQIIKLYVKKDTVGEPLSVSFVHEVKNSDGSTYIGTMLNDKMHGNGKSTFKNGDVYDGEYKDGKRDGKGKYTNKHGDVYDGEWKDGKADGKGKVTYANGDVYDGEWKDGKKDGKGKVTYANGHVYDVYNNVKLTTQLH